MALTKQISFSHIIVYKALPDDDGQLS